MENKIQKTIFWVSAPMFLYHSAMQNSPGNADLAQFFIGIMVFAAGAKIFSANNQTK